MGASELFYRLARRLGQFVGLSHARRESDAPAFAEGGPTDYGADGGDDRPATPAPNDVQEEIPFRSPGFEQREKARLLREQATRLDTNETNQKLRRTPEALDRQQISSTSGEAPLARSTTSTRQSAAPPELESLAPQAAAPLELSKGPVPSASAPIEPEEPEKKTETVDMRAVPDRLLRAIERLTVLPSKAPRPALRPSESDVENCAGLLATIVHQEKMFALHGLTKGSQSDLNTDKMLAQLPFSEARELIALHETVSNSGILHPDEHRFLSELRRLGYKQ